MKEKSLSVVLFIAIIIIGLFSYNLIRLGGVYEKEKQKNITLTEQLQQCSFDITTKDEEIKTLKQNLKEAEHIRHVQYDQLKELSKSAAKLGWEARGHRGMTFQGLMELME